MTEPTRAPFDDRTWELPRFDEARYRDKRNRYALVIPVINEGARIQGQLRRIQAAQLPVDVIVADGGSTDGSLEAGFVTDAGVTAVLTKTGPGKLSAQLRMAYAWCLRQGYDGIVTIDGNGKDGVEAIADMTAMLDDGYDYVQGSRYLAGGKAENTPLERTIANRLIHAPVLSLAGRHWFTDTTNGFRAYSVSYLLDPRVQPFRAEFENYELLFYLTARAGQIGAKVGQVGVVRSYPTEEKTPTKITGLRSKTKVLEQTLSVAFGAYAPDPATGPEAAAQPRPNPVGWGLMILLGALLVFRLLGFAERGLWVDEVSQMLNYPLEGLLAAFGPLPQAQQAAPPLFNLLLNLAYGLEYSTLRLLLSGLILAILLLAIGRATAWSGFVLAAVVIILLSSFAVLSQTTELKFYGLEAAGFALVTVWAFRKSPQAAFCAADALLLLGAMLLGISTLVGALLAAGLFAGLRLSQSRLTRSELLLLAGLGLAGLLYYLQLSHATHLQMTTFAQYAYSISGPGAVLMTMRTLIEVLGPLNSVLALLSLALLGLMARDMAQYRLLLLFVPGVLGCFFLLSLIGKYPVTAPRHVFWIYGLYTPLLGIVLAGLWARGVTLALSLKLLLSGVYIGLLALMLLHSLLFKPRPQSGAFEQIVSRLEAMEPATVLLYYGGYRLVPLAQSRGAAIDHHQFGPYISTRSRLVDPGFHDPAFLSGDAETIATRMTEQLVENGDGTWATAISTMWLTRDFTPLAAFVLDQAPGEGAPFYLVGFHIDPVPAEFRFRALTAELEARGCDFDLVEAFTTPRSPGFLLRAACP